jgi:hypothetical protein
MLAREAEALPRNAADRAENGDAGAMRLGLECVPAPALGRPRPL